MPYAYRGQARSRVLVSQSRDGELIARTRGASRDRHQPRLEQPGRRGRRCGRCCARRAQGYDLAFTPDGPRGPAGVVQPGVILAAAATGLPIQPVALAASRGAGACVPGTASCVPLPLSTVHFVYGEPLAVERRGDPAARAPPSSKRRLRRSAGGKRRRGWHKDEERRCAA